MQTHARVIIIGGGAVGTSALYHLARRGWSDALLIERDELTSGSTWHAAGNCPNFSTSWNVIKFQRYSTRLYADSARGRLSHQLSRHRLDPPRAHARPHGRISPTSARWRARRASTSRSSRPTRSKQSYPFITLDDIVGGLHDPLDGDIDPSQLTQAFAKGARDLGAKIERFTRVIGDRAHGERRVARCEPTRATITCEYLVNAAGYRAGEVMAMVGQYLPIVSMSHQYLVTEPIAELAAPQGKAAAAARSRCQLLPAAGARRPAPRPLRMAGDAALAGRRFPTISRTSSIPTISTGSRAISRRRWRACRSSAGSACSASSTARSPIRPTATPISAPRTGCTNFFHCCCFSLRHRAGRRRRQDAGGMDRRRRARMGFLDLRSAPLHRLRDQVLRRRQGDRALPERIRRSLIRSKSAPPAAPPRRRRSTTG